MRTRKPDTTVVVDIRAIRDTINGRLGIRGLYCGCHLPIPNRIRLWGHLIDMNECATCGGVILADGCQQLELELS